MKSENISDKQGIAIMLLFLLGSNLVLGTAGAAKKDAWAAVIIATIVSQFILIVHARILSLYPHNSVFDINEMIFGKFLGRLINIFYTIFAVHLGAIVLNNFTDFISTIGLPDTPQIVPVAFIIILCIWVSKEGIEVLGRLSQLCVIIIIIIMGTATLLSIPRWNLDNIRPLLHTDFKSLIKGIVSAFFFPFGDSMIFLMIFDSLKNKKSPYKVFIISSLICGLTLTVLTLRNIMILGEELMKINYYPSYISIGKINIGEFIQRIEIVVMAAFVAAGFVKISCCLLAAAKGAAKIFDFQDYRFVVLPIGLVITALSFKVFENMQENVMWNDIYMPYYMAIYEVIIVLITYIRAEFFIKKRAKLNRV